MNDIEAGRRRLAMTNHALWVGYFELGGNASLAEVGRWLSGETPMPPQDHDMLAVALNEAFSDLGLNHPVGFSAESEARAPALTAWLAGPPGAGPSSPG
jgi:hypothetical protein